MMTMCSVQVCTVVFLYPDTDHMLIQGANGVIMFTIYNILFDASVIMVVYNPFIYTVQCCKFRIEQGSTFVFCHVS